MTNPNYIEVDGVKYVPESKKSLSGYSMVRTYSAGVFCGKIKERNGKEAVLEDARRIWHWKGAATLSQLSQIGTSKPKDCKFPTPVSEVTLTEVIEIIPVTEEAKKSIDSVEVWKA